MVVTEGFLESFFFFFFFIGDDGVGEGGTKVGRRLIGLLFLTLVIQYFRMCFTALILEWVICRECLNALLGNIAFIYNFRESNYNDVAKKRI